MPRIVDLDSPMEHRRRTFNLSPSDSLTVHGRHETREPSYSEPEDEDDIIFFEGIAHTFLRFGTRWEMTEKDLHQERRRL